MMLDRAARFLLAVMCLGGATACGDGGPTSPTPPAETMIAPASIIGRTVTVTIREAHTRCTAPPGTVVHYHFENADTVRGVRADGVFDFPTKAWSYTRTGSRSAQIEITSGWRSPPTPVEPSSSGISPPRAKSTARVASVRPRTDALGGVGVDGMEPTHLPLADRRFIGPGGHPAGVPSSDGLCVAGALLLWGAAHIFGVAAATPVAQPRALWERQRIAQAAGLTPGIGWGEWGRPGG